MACAAHDVCAQINRTSTMRGSTSRVACASRCSGLRVATTGRRRGAWQQSLGLQPTCRAMPEGANDRQSTAMGLDPNLELEVPKDQRPVNELAQLRGANLYSWATLDLSTYIRNLSVIFAVTFAVVSGPISYQTFDPFRQPLEWVLASSVGSLVVVSLAALRIYLGWSYVSDRLLSASVEYEETGWYDGQVFVKPPEVLARDRLLGVYEVKPALGRVKRTLVGSSLLLLSCFITLSILIRVGADADNFYGRGAAVKPTTVTDSGIIYSKSVASLSQLKLDDDLAAEEALAQGGRPGYCADRYYRAAAGGQYCSKFD